MNIGFLGTGSVSQKLGQLLLGAGYHVRLGSRNPGERRAKFLNMHVELDTYPAVTEWAEVVVLSIPYDTLIEVLPPLEDQLTDKIVIDVTNPINADWSPKLLGEQNSAGEEVAQLLPQSHVVKAFNTVFADVMEAEKITSVSEGMAGFYCGNHSPANQTVEKLISDIGLRPVAVGNIENARYLEAMAHLNIRLAVGMQGGTQAAFTYVRV